MRQFAVREFAMLAMRRLGMHRFAVRGFAGLRLAGLRGGVPGSRICRGRLGSHGGDSNAGRPIFVVVIVRLCGTGLLGLHRQQSLPVGDGDLVIVRVDFAERQKAVPAAAIFHEGGLQAGFNPHHLGEVDIALQLLLRRCLDVEILEAVTVQHHHAGFFRVAGIDQHALGHSARISGAPPAHAPHRRGKDG